MPGTPKPVGASQGLPTIWNALILKLMSLDHRLSGVEGSHTPSIFDGYGNTIELSGTNLNQTVTIGAAFQQPGVMVGTNLTGAGRATQKNLVTTTITLTAGSTAATVASSTGMTDGMVIGAADVSDPSTGIATPAITPGTTISAISGTSITLSAKAAESGTSLYCAAANFNRA